MTKRMLIDASHAEETRVVVLDGNRLEDYDVETATKKHLKGNIYLAKVVRVEPSLQAAFVEFGGNRHGFLPFGEIHPDYYQIPKADRDRLIALAEEEARAEQEAEDEEDGIAPPSAHATVSLLPALIEAVTEVSADADGESSGEDVQPAPAGGDVQPAPAGGDFQPAPAGGDVQPAPAGGDFQPAPAGGDVQPAPAGGDFPAHAATQPLDMASFEIHGGEIHLVEAVGDEPGADEPVGSDAVRDEASGDEASGEGGEPEAALRETAAAEAAEAAAELDSPREYEPPPETVGGESEASEEARERRASPRYMRHYKIQEVIRRRQILLIQVVKEERKTKDGYKGASLTTYISLAGRFCVLMPNSPRGGGISRKITSAADRRRLKEITSELDIPRGMGMIVRTAGAARPKPEIKRDCEYLMRLWDDIRDTTMQSVAPAMIYEEASLIKRAIRDVYSRDVEEILVDGEEGWKAAHDFMRMLMPAHARKVQLWRDGGQPLFARQQVEAQLDQMLSPTVQLRSGGYLVIDQTEALVAIDVNSGRSTRERGIEETALRTNMEAAEEVARQLRLRDLAGIIVIDFIDMESKRNNAMVERRIKDALKNDRARIQVGQISHFGLLEMSRQRLRPSLAETSFVACPHCGGSGHVRSTDSAALHVLRAVEEEGSRRRAAEILVSVASSIALYILNHKRDRLSEIEERYEMRIGFSADDTLQPPQVRIDRLRPALPPSERPLPAPERVAERLGERVGERVGELGPERGYDRASARHIPIASRETEPEEPTEDDDIAFPQGTPAEVALAERPPAEGVFAEASGEEASGEEASGEEEERPVPGETAEEGEHRRRRRRRRRRPGARREDSAEPPARLASSASGEAGEAASVTGETDADGFATTAPALPAAASDSDADGAVEPGESEPPVTVGVAAADTGDSGGAEGSEDEAGRRRRGRRGGRRRRRDEDGDLASAPSKPTLDHAQTGYVATAHVAPAYIAPVYVGPTPADPFAVSTYDLLDVLDEAEQREAARLERPSQRGAGRASAQPVARMPEEPREETQAQPGAEPGAEPVTEPVAEPVAEPLLASGVVNHASTPEEPPSEDETPQAEPSPGIKPVLVGAEPVAEKRRGWWRR